MKLASAASDWSATPAFDVLPVSEDIDTMFAEEFDTGLRETDPDCAKLYRTCEENDVGITAMRAFSAADCLMRSALRSACPSRSECRKPRSCSGAEKRLANKQVSLTCCAITNVTVALQKSQKP